MKIAKDNSSCEICGGLATIELLDTSTDTNHHYCPQHRPELGPARNAHLQVKRSRLEPNNALSRKMAAAEDSWEHESFRIEMCELQILAADGACRYYLSKLTKTDQFAVWDDEFLQSMRKYVVATTQGAAACFSFEVGTVGAMVPLLRYAYEQTRTVTAFRQSKSDRAVVLLLHHPTWTDEQVAKKVPTTLRQLHRNSNYTLLRRAMIGKPALQQLE